MNTGNQILHDIFVQADDTVDYARDLDVATNSTTSTRTMRQADVTTTIDVYDSQGNPRTVTVAYAMDTTNAPGTANMLATDLVDEFGRSLFQVGDVFEFGGGTVNGDDLTDVAIWTITDTTTLDELATKIAAALDATDVTTPANTYSVTINSDGSLNIAADGAIVGATFRIDGTPLSSVNAVFTNSGGGAGGVFAVGAGLSANTNALWGPNSLLNTWNWAGYSTLYSTRASS